MNYKNDKELKAENQRWADYSKNLNGRKPHPLYVKVHAERVAYLSGEKK